MAAGLGFLRLRPADFWAMTPREFAAALHGRGRRPSHAAMPRGELARLMDRFPDRV